MAAEQVLVNYGALGVIASVLLVFAKQTIDRLVQERDRAGQQRDELMRDLLTEVSPALQGAIKAMDRRQSLDDEIFDVLIDIRRMLEARP